jgi:mono/diheme cytochrome c family protein
VSPWWVALLVIAGCDVERRKSDAELGLTPQQATGRQLYDNYCDRCHEPYSSRGKKGPSHERRVQAAVPFSEWITRKRRRVTDIVKFGRAKMEGFNQVMTDQQIKDLLVYLHTL